MLQPSPVEKIPDGPTTPEVAYQMVKDETFAQTQPRLNQMCIRDRFYFIDIGTHFRKIKSHDEKLIVELRRMLTYV